MKALAMLMFFVGLAFVMRPDTEKRFESALDEVVATNFLTYRSAAYRYVYEHRDETGQIATTKLQLLNNYRPLRNWHTLVENGVCYIYGDLTMNEVNAVKRLMKETMGIGFVRNGFMVNAHGGGMIPVPSSIPEGYLVSVSNLD